MANKLPVPPSQFVGVAGYDSSSDAWYALSIDPTSGAMIQRSESTQLDQLASGQVSVGTGGTLIVAARASRGSVVLVNTGSVTVYIGGDNNVNASTGLPLLANAAITIPGGAAVYGKTGSSSATVGYMETY